MPGPRYLDSDPTPDAGAEEALAYGVERERASEPSYYEIALTSRQVLVAFVILLASVVVAFFSGVWIGRSDAASAAPPQVARGEAARPAGAPRTARPAPTKPAAAGGSAAAAAKEPEEFQFFSENPNRPAGRRPAGSPPAAAAPTLIDELEASAAEADAADAAVAGEEVAEGPGVAIVAQPAPAPAISRPVSSSPTASSSAGPSPTGARPTAPTPAAPAPALTRPSTVAAAGGTSPTVPAAARVPPAAAPATPATRGTAAPQSTSAPSTSRTAPAQPLPVTPAATAPAAPASAGRVIVQVFSSADEAQARRVQDQLREGGFRGAFLSPANREGTVMHRVRLGPFATEAEARTIAEQIKAKLHLDTWVTAP